MRNYIKNVHFVGIGGAGMSGIAEVLLNLGFEVSGSDTARNASVVRLQGLGARVFTGHQASQIHGAEVVVVSTAVGVDNPEVVAARENHIPVISRAAMLAELMRLKEGIAIAGTHGKTTTTSLIASVLGEAGLDPTFVIGGLLNHAGSHAGLGSGRYLVAEADESDGSFLLLQPVISVLTNIDHDHMETYGHDVARLHHAFREFIDKLPFYGLLVLCLEDPVLREWIPSLKHRVITYGFTSNAHLCAVNIRPFGHQMHFDVEWRSEGGGDIERTLSVCLNIPGHHNVLNSLAALAVGQVVGASYPAMLRALELFKGVGRRFQRYEHRLLPQGGAVHVVDDYGHHPVEIEVTMRAARGAYPQQRLVLVFQPHRYTRTRDCFAEFVRVLALADELWLLPIYSAGEVKIEGVGSAYLQAAIMAQYGHILVSLVSIEEAVLALMPNLRDRDVVLVMGAGSIGSLVPRLLQEVKP